MGKDLGLPIGPRSLASFRGPCHERPSWKVFQAPLCKANRRLARHTTQASVFEYPGHPPILSLESTTLPPNQDTDTGLGSLTESIPSKREDSCLFCNIIAGISPSYVVYQDAHIFAILDIAPCAPGHTLVIPRMHTPRLEDLPFETTLQLGARLPVVAKRVMAGSGACDYHILQNNGSSAGQMVSHVHFHIIPRWPGDEKLQFSQCGSLDKEDAEALLKRIRQTS